ncbi:DUF1446-domain-containing protein [Xylariaceae sp. FL0804]|nr:DUF1446-domain-containing protein [Xylariaceae sp. FL0804]
MAPTTTRRPVRIANCSGATPDPGELMLSQATAGPVDVVVGDYLAEANMAASAEAHANGRHPGWVASAERGLRLSLAAVHARGIRVVVNGGGLNPRGLARLVRRMAAEAGLGGGDGGIRVACVEGDDLLPRARELLLGGGGSGSGRLALPRLDADNPLVKLDDEDAGDFFIGDDDDDDGGDGGGDRGGKKKKKKIVAANAYLGCRAIRAGLAAGADVVVCGRVADASPVMGAAAWWHGWDEAADWDALAGALVAGHLIECSTYGSGANFAGFDRYATHELLGLAPPIAEVAADGSAVITVHEALRGIVTEEVVKCQMLYELQGNIYLNSDVKADITDVEVRQVGRNRVRVWGARGHPPPPTTKLAIFYSGGWQGELTLNATGYATEAKYDLQEAQLRAQLDAWGVTADLDVLELQRVGVPAPNPRSQLEATTYMRIFAQAQKPETVRRVFEAWSYNFMQHFPGMACTLNHRLMSEPAPFLRYLPTLVPQHEIRETVTLLKPGIDDDEPGTTIVVGPPRITEPLRPRENYDPVAPRPLSSFGPTRLAPLGDVALARSGDKGANVNVGFTPRGDLGSNVAVAEEAWEWLRAFLTRARLRALMGSDWREGGAYHVERVELPRLRAVHFVVYGALGPGGVSSSARIDSLGKGFAEWLRAVRVPVPERFLLVGSRSGSGSGSGGVASSRL